MHTIPLLKTKAYQRAFASYLRRGTPIEYSLKASQRETTHYIWHTQGDDRVRTEHADREGQVFAWDDPDVSPPGSEYGCRCWAEPLDLPKLPPIPKPSTVEDLARIIAQAALLILAGSITWEALSAILIRRVGIEAGNEILKEVRKEVSRPIEKPILRRQYEAEVRDLKKLADQLKTQNKTPEEIAKTLSSKRREIGEKYKDLTPEFIREKIYKRNLERYGDKLGPSVDELLRRGKTWDDIIQSAQTPGGSDLF